MYVEILILATLQLKPHHGYEMKKYIERLLGGYLSLNNTVLYPTLKRFEKIGAVQREVEHQSGKPDRHVYYLTRQGNELLQTSLADFSPAMAENNAEFFTRVAFFNLLEPEIRVDILRKRTAIIQKKLLHLQALQQQSGEPTMPHPNPYANSVLEFHQRAMHAEATWLQEMLIKSLPSDA